MEQKELTVNADTKHIAQPTNIGNVALRNRLAVAPMTRVSATERGDATAQMAQYYNRFARGGFGLLITEGLYIDSTHSQGYIFQPGMIDDAQAQSWKGITSATHDAGAKIIAQIQHAGALSQGNRFNYGPLAPSAVKPKGSQMTFYYGKDDYRIPAAMTESQIADVIAAFATAARRAVEISGFDGVELHGANGYLLDQFLTDYTNQRDDRYGGSVQNRLTMLVEAVKAVKVAVAGKVPVGIRISQAKVNDFTHKWSEGEAGAEATFGGLSAAGADYIHITEFEAWQPAFAPGGPSLAALAHKHGAGVPVIANGSLHDPERANEVLAQGADVISLGRGALANPDWPNLVAGAHATREFDPSILGPIANIKESELNL